MVKTLLSLIFCCGMVSLGTAQTSYPWSTYTTGGTLATPYTYSIANMTATVTNTNFDTRGPQSPLGGASSGYRNPKYIVSPNASAPDYQMTGLCMALDWANLGSSTTVTITFTTPVCGPVSFNIYDINQGTWGGWLPVWIDRVTISGTNSLGTTIYPAITGCANTISGASSNIITGTLGCTNNTNTVTFSSADVKTITIVYSSGSPLASGYGTNPDPQYIVIGTISSTSCGPLAEIGDFNVQCEAGHPSLSWTAPVLASALQFDVLRSANGETFEPIGTVSGGNSIHYSYTDLEAQNGQFYYRIAEKDNNGNVWYTHTLSADGRCGALTGSARVFPNPARDVISIETIGEAPGHIQLLSPDGRTIMEFLLEGNTARTINLTELRPGMYWLKVVQDGKVSVHPLVKE